MPIPTIQPIPIPTSPSELIFIKIILSKIMIELVMKLNKTNNFILCFIFKITLAIAFIITNIAEIDKYFNRINPSSEYSFPNANKNNFYNYYPCNYCNLSIGKLYFIGIWKRILL